FVATKILKGVFIGHYGAETHTLKLVSLQAAGTYMQYLAKLLGYAHFFTYKIREAVYELLKNGWVIATSASMFLAFSIYFLKNNFRKTIVPLAILLLAFLCLLPMSTMYFMYLNQVENDRLSYFASFFIYLFLSLMLSYAGRKLLLFSCLALILVNIYFLKDYTSRWVNAGILQDKAIATFEWQNADRVFILNQPCYYKGVYVFRSKNRLYRALKIFKNIDMKDRLIEAAWSNYNSLEDDVLVEQLSRNEIKITLAQWGGWFWYLNRGALSYNTETHSATFDEWQHSYELKLHEPLRDNDVI